MRFNFLTLCSLVLVSLLHVSRGISGGRCASLSEAAAAVSRGGMGRKRKKKGGSCSVIKIVWR